MTKNALIPSLRKKNRLIYLSKSKLCYKIIDNKVKECARFICNSNLSNILLCEDDNKVYKSFSYL